MILYVSYELLTPALPDETFLTPSFMYRNDIRSLNESNNEIIVIIDNP